MSPKPRFQNNIDHHAYQTNKTTTEQIKHDKLQPTLISIELNFVFVYNLLPV